MTDIEICKRPAGQVTRTQVDKKSYLKRLQQKRRSIVKGRLKNEIYHLRNARLLEHSSISIRELYSNLPRTKEEFISGLRRNAKRIAVLYVNYFMSAEK